VLSEDAMVPLDFQLDSDGTLPTIHEQLFRQEAWPMSPGRFPFSDRALFPDTDLSDWCEKWDLSVFDGSCSKCGASLRVDIPFVAKDARGLIAQKCRCGNDLVPFVFVETGPDAPLGLGRLEGGQ
jgi:hypothetical protein